jgi:hypothetical protein
MARLGAAEADWTILCRLRISWNLFSPPFKTKTGGGYLPSLTPPVLQNMQHCIDSYSNRVIPLPVRINVAKTSA